MSDPGKAKGIPSIPPWQQKQQPLDSQPSVATPQSAVRTLAGAEKSSAGQSTTDGSDIAAKQEFEASKAIPPTLQEPKEASINRSGSDGSNIAAKQEFDASKSTPEDLGPIGQPHAPASDTDGSAIAAKQEFEATKVVNDHVYKFLDNPEVKGAPLEKKRAFLESKGVQKEVIQEALAVVESTPASISATDFTATLRGPSLPQNSKDAPPIVTYPEFLIQPQNPPPIVTVDRLLTTAYVTGGLVATIYGLSKYIIAPMSAALAEARHEFSLHTSSRVSNMNEKLADLVSSLPVSTKSNPASEAGNDSDDPESDVSDPTELFHRDIGTQTSSPPSPESQTTDVYSSSSIRAESETILSEQEAHLQRLNSHISKLLAASEDNRDTNEDVERSMDDLRHVLDNMVYSPPAYHYQAGDTVWTPPGTVSTAAKDKKDDAVALFKAEIRGVKGVLLSAKRFPSAAVVR